MMKKISRKYLCKSMGKSSHEYKTLLFGMMHSMRGLRSNRVIFDQGRLTINSSKTNYDFKRQTDKIVSNDRVYFEHEASH